MNIETKGYKEYDYSSRYAPFPYYFSAKDNKFYCGLTSHIKKDIKYIVHKVKKGDTLDSLALYFFNNPTYYWIIADFNSIQDPYTQLDVGTTLKIPTFSNIEFDI